MNVPRNSKPDHVTPSDFVRHDFLFSASRPNNERTKANDCYKFCLVFNDKYRAVHGELDSHHERIILRLPAAR